MNDLKIQEQSNYLALPTDQLLSEFGKGRHIPGSGSAAAFSGLLAVELMKTVCKLTLDRIEPKYTSQRGDFNIILEKLEKEAIPRFTYYFNEDIRIFNELSNLRIARDKAKAMEDNKMYRKMVKRVDDQLKKATELPLDVANYSLLLIDYAFTIFDRGFQSARGDSGVAISNLLSTISGSLFVAMINIRYGKNSKWAEELRSRAETIGVTFNEKQKNSLTKVLQLYKEGIVQSDYQLKLAFD